MRVTAIMIGLLLTGCDRGAPANSTYTLYRGSIAEVGGRVHMATFDAAESGSYNMENCNIARGLFEAQPGVTVRYWCELGRYREK